MYAMLHVCLVHKLTSTQSSPFTQGYIEISPEEGCDWQQVISINFNENLQDYWTMLQ